MLINEFKNFLFTKYGLTLIFFWLLGFQKIRKSGLVHPAGIEPTTSWSEAKRSIH